MSMFGQIRPKLSDSVGTPPTPVKSGRIPTILARSGRISGRIRPDQDGSRPFWPDQAGFRPISDHGRIQARFCRNLVRRHRATMAINRFSKIKEAFTVKPKMVFVDHYFRHYQTP
jgi:hypothetical protein